MGSEIGRLVDLFVGSFLKSPTKNTFDSFGCMSLQRLVVVFVGCWPFFCFFFCLG